MEATILTLTFMMALGACVGVSLLWQQQGTAEPYDPQAQERWLNAFSAWMDARVDQRIGQERLNRKAREQENVSSCSAKERITEMRLRALETGQPIDTMELVREALAVLERPSGSSYTGYGDVYQQYYNRLLARRDEALALLRFAVERADSDQPATESWKAI